MFWRDGLHNADIETLFCAVDCNRALQLQSYTTIKIRSEFRNVGDTGYTMSHLSAAACTQRLAAGRGHGYRLAAATASTAQARHWQWSSLLNVNNDQSVQRDKPLDGSIGANRGGAPSVSLHTAYSRCAICHSY